MRRLTAPSTRALAVVCGLALALAAGWFWASPAPTGSAAASTDGPENGSPTGTSASGVADNTPVAPSVDAVYPNPVTDEDRGEFVALSVPPGTVLDEFRLEDGEDTVVLNGTASGRVTLSTAPNATERLTGRPTRHLSTALSLSNAGETLRLRHGNRTVDTLSYTSAPEGEVFDASGTWRPLGATDRPVVDAASGRARAFVLPDAPTLAVSRLQAADRRVLLAGYTLSSRAATTALVGAVRRNVTVRVLVDGGPVGGMSARMANRLDRLAAAGAAVRVLDGPRARYAFHHAKYAVVDGHALVTTENWKPSGTGGHGSRGWGVVTDQPAVVRGLTDTFRADIGWYDAVPWQEARRDLSTTDGGVPANESYPRRFDPRRVHVEGTRLLVAPDNAERAVVGLVRNATESVRVEQVSVGGRRQPFLRATVEAARRGVAVRVLLSGAWYVREDNRNLTAYLNERARDEGLDLKARVADPRGRYGKIHAKGVVVDGDRVVLGSLNWNNYSARQNREVAVVLEGREPARYFGRVFRADWRGGRWTLPAGVALASVTAAVVAAWRGRRIDFV
ncbi:MAG: phosphatidylserine/phosphatidylglycerophosphate/cardiolipin synthase-like enzyme [Salinirussus sp.]